jgi:predicted Zn-dependent protease with MMP-like domain
MGPVTIEMSAEEFDQLADSAVGQLPTEFTDLIDNVAIMIEEAPPPDTPGLLGVYQGIPLTERDSGYAGTLPDRIVIFRGPILAICDTREQVISQVGITVAHEIAHYFGIGDAALERLGYG